MVLIVMWSAAAVLGDEPLDEAARRLRDFTPDGIGADGALRRVADLGDGSG